MPKPADLAVLGLRPHDYFTVTPSLSTLTAAAARNGVLWVSGRAPDRGLCRVSNKQRHSSTLPLYTRGRTPSTKHPCDRRESIARLAFAQRCAWRRALVLDVGWEPAGAGAGSRPPPGRLATAGKRSIRGERGEDASADLGDRRGAGIRARPCPWRNMATDGCAALGRVSAWLGSSSATSWPHQATSVLIAQTVTCIWAGGGSLDSRSSSSD